MTRWLLEAWLRIAICLALAASATPQAVDAAKPGESMKVRFEYAAKWNSLLLHARVNGKPVLLILDTGVAHTILRPGLLGVKRSEVGPARKWSSGGGFLGNAVSREVTLQVGDHAWPKYRVSVMDLSEILAAYPEDPDGLLGLDFLQNYRQVAIDWRERKISLTR